jgi:hypothetical protein
VDLAAIEASSSSQKSLSGNRGPQKKRLLLTPEVKEGYRMRLKAA